MSNKRIVVVISIFLFLVVQPDCTANNVIGGYLQIRNLDNTLSHLRISLRLHVDQTNGSFSDNEVSVKMIRKSDSTEIQSFKLLRNFVDYVAYDQETCFGVVSLNTIYANYEADVVLYPPSYADPLGYYLVWTDCCRTPNITNFRDPGSYSITLSTFFPPIFYLDYPFFNSTPEINDLNKVFICKNEPFKYKITANDLNGDKLKFSLVHPLGYHKSSNSPMDWQTGYSVTNAIPGSPGLKIDPETGLLSVNPESIGLFVFAVCVEEFRDGRRIGATVREYRLYILNCSPPSNADRNVYSNDSPVTTATICPGDTLTFNAKTNPDWSYQWMRNGYIIPGATYDSLEVVEDGDYSFNIVQSGACSKTIESNKVHVTGSNSSFKLEKHEISTACDQHAGTVILGPKDLGYTYNWYKDSSLLANKSDSLTVSEPGNYWAILESSTCKLFSDTMAIEQSFEPVVKAEFDPISPVCGNEDTPIHLIGSPVGGVFQGPGVVGDIFYPKQAGIGAHQLTYLISPSAACPDVVARQTVEVYDWPKFDLSEEICVVRGIGSAIGVKESLGWRYEWFPLEGLDNPSVSMPVITTNRDILYNLTVTNSSGCKTSKQLQVKVCANLTIPDAFTPNEDGVNDIWELKGIDDYPNAEVTIFNRWGNVIYYSKGYKIPFDGVSNNAGTYPYKIKLNEILPLRTGSLMLIR